MRPVTTFPTSSGRSKKHGPNLDSTAVIDMPPQPLTDVLPIREISPSEHYQPLLVFNKGEDGQYCLAQAKIGTRYAYQVVLIKKVRARTIHKLHRPNPRILSILDAFHTHVTISLVLERPGVLLSRVVLAPSLSDEYICTICREVRPQM